MVNFISWWGGDVIEIEDDLITTDTSVIHLVIQVLIIYNRYDCTRISTRVG